MKYTNYKGKNIQKYSAGGIIGDVLSGAGGGALAGAGTGNPLGVAAGAIIGGGVGLIKGLHENNLERKAKEEREDAVKNGLLVRLQNDAINDNQQLANYPTNGYAINNLYSKGGAVKKGKTKLSAKDKAYQEFIAKQYKLLKLREANKNADSYGFNINNYRTPDKVNYAPTTRVINGSLVGLNQLVRGMGSAIFPNNKQVQSFGNYFKGIGQAATQTSSEHNSIYGNNPKLTDNANAETAINALSLAIPAVRGGEYANELSSAYNSGLKKIAGKIGSKFANAVEPAIDFVTKADGIEHPISGNTKQLIKGRINSITNNGDETTIQYLKNLYGEELRKSIPNADKSTIDKQVNTGFNKWLEHMSSSEANNILSNREAILRERTPYNGKYNIPNINEETPLINKYNNSNYIGGKSEAINNNPLGIIPNYKDPISINPTIIPKERRLPIATSDKTEIGNIQWRNRGIKEVNKVPEIKQINSNSITKPADLVKYQLYYYRNVKGTQADRGISTFLDYVKTDNKYKSAIDNEISNGFGGTTETVKPISKPIHNNIINKPTINKPIVNDEPSIPINKPIKIDKHNNEVINTPISKPISKANVELDDASRMTRIRELFNKYGHPLREDRGANFMYNRLSSKSSPLYDGFSDADKQEAVSLAFNLGKNLHYSMGGTISKSLSSIQTPALKSKIGTGIEVSGIPGKDNIPAKVGNKNIKLDNKEIIVKYNGKDVVISDDLGEADKYRAEIANGNNPKQVADKYAQRAIMLQQSNSSNHYDTGGPINDSTYIPNSDSIRQVDSLEQLYSINNMVQDSDGNWIYDNGKMPTGVGLTGYNTLTNPQYSTNDFDFTKNQPTNIPTNIPTVNNANIQTNSIASRNRLNPIIDNMPTSYIPTINNIDDTLLNMPNRSQGVEIQDTVHPNGISRLGFNLGNSGFGNFIGKNGTTIAQGASALGSIISNISANRKLKDINVPEPIFQKYITQDVNANQPIFNNEENSVYRSINEINSNITNNTSNSNVALARMNETRSKEINAINQITAQQIADRNRIENRNTRGMNIVGMRNNRIANQYNQQVYGKQIGDIQSDLSLTGSTLNTVNGFINNANKSNYQNDYLEAIAKQVGYTPKAGEPFNYKEFFNQLSADKKKELLALLNK